MKSIKSDAFQMPFSMSLMCQCVFSWFLDSAKIYSPLGMVQLICSEICMAITIFNFHSVFFLPLNLISSFNFYPKESICLLYVLATRTHQFDNGDCYFIRFDKHVKSTNLLLLWKISIWKLWKNVRFCIFQFKLAWISN